MRKESTWKNPRVAGEYDARRFGGTLGRRKQRHDEALVVGLLARHGARGRILDLPVGTGRLVPALSAAGHEVVGGDVSPEMLAAARERGAAALVLANASRLPFPDGAFGGLCSIRFLFHLDGREERIRVLRELGRVTSGPLVLQVRYRSTAKHLGRWIRGRVGLGRRPRPALDRSGLGGELSEAGLELLELRPVSYLFSDKALLVARRRTNG